MTERKTERKTEQNVTSVVQYDDKAERKIIQGSTYLIRCDRLEGMWYGMNLDEYQAGNDDCLSDLFDTKEELIDELQRGW